MSDCLDRLQALFPVTYRHGNILLINGDNMELMAHIKDAEFELSCVDPPYRDSNQPTKEMRKNGSMQTLEGRPCKNYWNELKRVSKEQIIWGANNFELPQYKGFVVWEKGIPLDFTMSMAEIAALSDGLGTISKICSIRASGADISRIHPTQKPLKLYEWLLTNYAKPIRRINARKFKLTISDMPHHFHAIGVYQ